MCVCVCAWIYNRYILLCGNGSSESEKIIKIRGKINKSDAFKGFSNDGELNITTK